MAVTPHYFLNDYFLNGFAVAIHRTETVISEPDAAVNCWSGWTTAAFVIFTGKRPAVFAWKVYNAVTRDSF